MMDCLQAIEVTFPTVSRIRFLIYFRLQDVTETCSELSECVMKALHWFYEKDVLSEDAIMPWFSKLEENSRLRVKIQPFIKWLQEADEESDSE